MACVRCCSVQVTCQGTCPQRTHCSAPGEVANEGHDAHRHGAHVPVAILPVLLPDPNAGCQRAGLPEVDGGEGDLGAGPPVVASNGCKSAVAGQTLDIEH